jgi:SAM-dependent methyltransferase
VGKSGNDANPTYWLSAAGREAAEDERLSLLETIFDPTSRQRRSMVQQGWRCLEIGAGRGSMAVWLAQQVGEKGRVVATDIDVTYLERLNLPNLEVRRHNILEDPIETLSLASFDMVSLRLVLFWLVGRQEEVIRRMVQCLRPGGWLVDEDGDWGTVVPVNPFHPMYERYEQVWKGGDWLAARGYDPEFGRKLPALIERCGLQSIRHEAHVEVLRATSPWGRWWLQTLEGWRAWDEAAGVLTEAREEEYGILTAPWSDPSFWFQTAVIHACWAQRPA